MIYKENLNFKKQLQVFWIRTQDHVEGIEMPKKAPTGI